MKWKSSSFACRPVVFKAVVEQATAQSEDGVSASDGSEHTGLLAAGTDDGFAPCFNDARADKEMLRPEFLIAHPLGVFFKVGGFYADLFEQLRI